MSVTKTYWWGNEASHPPNSCCHSSAASVLTYPSGWRFLLSEALLCPISCSDRPKANRSSTSGGTAMQQQEEWGLFPPLLRAPCCFPRSAHSHFPLVHFSRLPHLPCQPDGRRKVLILTVPAVNLSECMHLLMSSVLEEWSSSRTRAILLNLLQENECIFFSA